MVKGIKMDITKNINGIATQSLGECWLKCIEHIVETGTVQQDEDVNLYEVLGLSIEISAPSSKDAIIEKYGDTKVISKMLAKFSKGIVMEDRPFTYGERIYNQQGIDQFEWIVARLQTKQQTKSATIGLLLPGDNDPNLPCLSTLDVKIRNGKLELQFFFRSQNIFGRQYANLLALVDLQSKLAQRCKVAIGSIRGYIASAHIYEFDFKDAQKLLSGEYFQIQDNYYKKGPKSVRE